VQDVKIWVAFGSGKKFTYYHINRIFESLGMEKSLALPVFHCFTGRDTTSAFFGWGKKVSWEVWKCYDDVTHAFTYMALQPFADVNIHSTHFQVLEQFTVFLYDKTSDVEHVNGLFLHVKVTNYMRYIFINICSLLWNLGTSGTLEPLEPWNL